MNRSISFKTRSILTNLRATSCPQCGAIKIEEVPLDIPVYCKLKDNTLCVQSDHNPSCRGCQVFIDTLSELNGQAYEKLAADKQHMVDNLENYWKHSGV